MTGTLIALGRADTRRHLARAGPGKQLLELALGGGRPEVLQVVAGVPGENRLDAELLAQDGEGLVHRQPVGALGERREVS